MKALPDKYYLTHFLEFIQFIHTTSFHLLDESDRDFLSLFDQQSEDAKCLLVRMLNRKTAFIRKETLVYQEIEDSATAINSLRKAKYVARIGKESYAELVKELNKQELMSLAEVCQLEKPTKSATKQKWQNFVSNNINGELAYQVVKKHPVVKSYIHFAKQPIFHYLLFLYFGHLGGRLNQFSLRDLGVMQTQAVKQQQANFNDLQQAKSAFLHATSFHQIKTLVPDNQDALNVYCDAYLALPKPIGFYAEQKYHHGLYKLALLMLENEPALGEKLLALSGHPAAKEKYIRLLYKNGETTQCKKLLAEIIAEPQSESLLLFAEDFYAQKFDKKQTSILTDVLRQSPPAIHVDEAYLGQVESGVKAHYTRIGTTCFFTENKLWRALFALTFWYELYTHPEAERANEFSYFPKALKENTFYSKFKQQIDEKLATLSTANVFINHIKNKIAEKHGLPNGLFFWHTQLEEVLTAFLNHAPIPAVKAHLSAMANNFTELADGYPDLMIIDGKALYFEEIKAPGDSLRRNQLISIKQLIKAGFRVTVQRAEWQFNPNQSYVVVDIETTGGKKDAHRITEVGMVKIENGEIVDTWQSLVNPERHIPKMITSLTGISNEMVKNAPTFDQIADKLDTYCQNAIFVAHNVNFDYGFIKQEFARIDKPFSRAKICTVQQARKYLPGFKSYSLGKLSKDLGITLENHHRALDDAKAAAEILLRINTARANKKTERS